MNPDQEVVKNLDHMRAKYAYEKVIEIVNSEDEKVKKKFKSYVISTPSHILKNGLGTTLAFYKSKFEAKNDSGNAEAKAYKILYKFISQWIKDREYCEGGDVLEDCLIYMDNIKFAAATDEVLAMLNWMKMFVKAKIADEKEE